MHAKFSPTSVSPILLLFCAIITSHVMAQTADVTTGCVPLAVNFTAPGTSSSYYWDFGNGTTSILKDPSASFNSAGDYTVEFRESPSGPVLGSIPVTVYETPVLNVSSNLSEGCSPLTVDLTNNVVIDPAITVLDYGWVFGDGNTGTGSGNSISHTYVPDNFYNVSASILTPYPTCNRTDIFSNVVRVYGAPNVRFNAQPDPLVACAPPLNVRVINKSTGDYNPTYSWDFGNGNTSTLFSPPNQDYTVGGVFEIRLMGENDQGCRDTATKTVTVLDPGLTINVPDNVCKNNPVTFTSPISGDLTWDFGFGATVYNSADTTYDPISTSEDSSITIFFDSPGTRTITLTVDDGTCSIVATKDINVQEVPFTASLSESYSCQNPVTVNYTASSSSSGATFDWNFSDGTTSTGNSTSRTYFDSRDTVFYGITQESIKRTTLTVTDPSTGCVDTSVLDFVHFPANARLLPNKNKDEGCLPLSINFRDSSTSYIGDPIVSWTWHWDDGTPDETYPNGDNISHTYNTAGTFEAQMIVETASGCRDTSYAMVVEVGDDLSSQLDFTVAPTTLCPGDGITLTVTSAPPEVDQFHFYSEGNRTHHFPTETVVEWPFEFEVGSHDVELMVDYNGCLSSLTKADLVTVEGAIAEINYGANCEDPYTYRFRSLAQGVEMLTWDFGDGNTSTDSLPTHTYASTGDYTITLTAEDVSSGCPASVVTENITITDPVAAISVNQASCSGGELTINATGSSDVGCRGYTYNFPTLEDQRPITTIYDSYSITLPPKDSTELNGSSEPDIVEVVIMDIHGCTDTASIEMKYYDIQPNGSSSLSAICNPATVQFTDSTISDTTITSWAWILSTGDTLREQNPTYTFTDPPDNIDSTYSVSLYVENILGCSAQVDSLFTFKYYEIESAITKKRFFCGPDSARFEAKDDTTHGSNLSFFWDFGNGVTDTNRIATVYFDQDTPRDIRLIYTENSSGCVDTIETIQYMGISPITAFFSDVDEDSLLCAPITISFTDTSTHRLSHALSSTWDFGNGETGNTKTYSVTYPAGTYDVTLISRVKGNCPDTLTKTFEIFGPSGDFTIDNNNICVGDSIEFSVKDTADIESWIWFFGDGTDTMDVSTISHTYTFIPPSLQTTASITFSSKGCYITHDTVIHFTPVIADFIRNDGIDTSMCIQNNSFPFSDNSSNPIDFSWDFGDGIGTSDVANPDYTYGAAGVYNVRLAIRNDTLGCSDTVVKQIVITDPPDTRINFPRDTICLGDTVYLNILDATSTSTYTWGADEPFLSETASSASILLPVSDTITLTEEDDNGCITTIDTLITVYDITSSITHRNNICGPDTVRFAATNDPRPGFDLSFFWDFGNGETSTQMIDTAFFSEYKTHTVKLIYSETKFGCVDSIVVNEIVELYPLTGFFSTIDEDSVLCAPLEVTFTDTSQSQGVLTKAWDFDNGEDSDAATYSLTYPRGTYQVSLITTTPLGCSDTATKSYEVIQPEGSFTIDEDTICRGDDILFSITDTVDVDSWIWFFGDGTDTTNLSLISHTYDAIPPSFQTTASITFSKKGCQVSVDTNIHFVPIMADFTRQDGIDTTICVQNNSIHFTDNSTNPEMYAWDFGDGIGTSDTVNPSYSYSSAGVYDVRLAIENTTYGCYDTVVKKIVITDPPATQLSLSSHTVCLGDTLYSSVDNSSSSSTYTWDASEPFLNVTNESASIILPVSDTISLTEEDENHCITTVDTFITVIPHFEYFDWDTTIVLGNEAVLPINMGEGFEFTLSPDEDISCANCNYPTASPSEDIIYILTVSDNTGCFTDDYEFIVYIDPQAVLNMPSTFSPNGDAANDVVYARGLRLAELISYKIFNRWGQLIFETNDFDVGWDGTYNGVIQNSDVYVYQVTALSVDGKTLEAEGYIHLIK